MTHSINIGDILARNPTGATPLNITAQMRGWQDSVKDIGGFWQAGGQYWTGDDNDIVTRMEAEMFFASRLGAHIVRANESGDIGWEGQITQMSLAADGIVRRRSISDIVTKLRINYTRYTGNCLTNSSGEIGTHAIGQSWINETGLHIFRTSPYGNFPEAYFDNSWYTHGTRSIRISTHPLQTLDGGGVQFFSTTNVVPDGRYCVRVDLTVGAELGPGDYLTITVNDGSNQIYGRDISNSDLVARPTQTFARTFDAPGTSSGYLNVMVYCHGNGTIFWVDNAQLYQAGTPALTPWAENTVATAEWGLHEETVVCKPMTDGEALQRRDMLLSDWAHPRTVVRKMASTDELGLAIQCEGYIFKAASQSVQLGGVKTCSAHIADLLAASTYISTGYVATNAIECYIDETQSVGLWTSLQDVIEVGGSGNIAYIGGVYAGRKFNYELRPTVASVKFKGGRWLNLDNSRLNPQTVRPCIVLFEDAVTAEGQGSYSTLLNDPKYAYLSGWEWDADTNTATPTIEDEVR